jgi:hypothetical protein
MIPMAATRLCVSYSGGDGEIRWFGLESMGIYEYQNHSREAVCRHARSGRNMWNGEQIYKERTKKHTLCSPPPFMVLSPDVHTRTHKFGLYLICSARTRCDTARHSRARYDKCQHFMEFENSLPCSLESAIDLHFGSDEFHSANSHPISLTSSSIL